MDSIDTARRHYDSKAAPEGNSRQSLAKRAQGPAIELKKFHNSIKRSLIRTFAGKSKSLLDVGCGRGGDLSKWIDAGLEYVRGLDVSQHEIAEARRRHFESYKTLACDFKVCSTFGTHVYESPHLFDSVSCMFALHFFFETETSLDTCMANVSANLKDGGTFFGVVPSGSRIHHHKPNNSFVDVKRHYDTPRAFGSAYTCTIRDTVTSTTADSEGALEFLVDADVLCASAAKHGLVPIMHYDPALQHLFEPSESVFKCFKPRYSSTTHPDLADASRLFASFAFLKI
jgi:mRNA (guanine-N7-)-methyltransferase